VHHERLAFEGVLAEGTVEAVGVEAMLLFADSQALTAHNEFFATS
jgi:hypothetical protein